MVIVEVLVVREGFVLAVVMVMWVEVDILRCVSKRDCLNVCNVKLQVNRVKSLLAHSPAEQRDRVSRTLSLPHWNHLRLPSVGGGWGMYAGLHEYVHMQPVRARVPHMEACLLPMTPSEGERGGACPPCMYAFVVSFRFLGEGWGMYAGLHEYVYMQPVRARGPHMEACLLPMTPSEGERGGASPPCMYAFVVSFLFFEGEAGCLGMPGTFLLHDTFWYILAGHENTRVLNILSQYALFFSLTVARPLSALAAAPEEGTPGAQPPPQWNQNGKGAGDSGSDTDVVARGREGNQGAGRCERTWVGVRRKNGV